MAYQTLDSSRHEIRLLTVKVDESPIITCTLTTVSLMDVLSFKALSYNWGREKAPQLLLLDGEEMEITANLDQALRQLRHENHGLLFIDALCINQNNNSEKSEQVMLMKEIYSRATEVIAWLGPAEHHSDDAMELMKIFGNSGPKREMTPGLAGGYISTEECFADNVALWDAVDVLLGRNYWQRTWILQELALAKTVVLRCGTKSAAFEDLHAIYSVIGRWADSPDVRELTLRAAHLYSIALLLSLRDLDGMNKDGMPMTSILAESQDQLVSDLRDKVYGLLGMASDALILVPLLSYDISEAEVYTHLTRSLIVNSKRLAYIHHKSPFGKSSLEIPSWAMDLSTPCFDTSSGLSRHILHIPLDWKSGLEANIAFGDSSYGKETILIAWGKIMGTVDGIGSVLPIHSSFSGSQYNIVEPDYSANMYGSETATLEAILEALVGIYHDNSTEHALEDSFQLECHKFSIKVLMKPENRGLLALIPELSEWLDKNKQFIFAGRSLESWSSLAAEIVPVWEGSRLKEALIKPRGRFPHESTVGSNPRALVQGIADGIETSQAQDDTNNLVENLASLELNKAEDEDHTKSTSQVLRPELEGRRVYEKRHQFNISSEGRRFSIIPDSSSASGIWQSHKVFHRLVRALRNETATRNRRFPIAAALHNASKSSSLTENELEKIELTVKAMLVDLSRYKRIVTTSAGAIGMAHPQVHKNDQICYFRGCESSLVILREEPLSPDEPPRVPAWTRERPSGKVVSTNEDQAYKRFRVIGQASLSSFLRPELVHGLKWELFALI